MINVILENKNLANHASYFLILVHEKPAASFLKPQKALDVVVMMMEDNDVT